MVEKLYDQYWIVYCDNCEVKLDGEFETHQEAREAAKEAGWKATTANRHLQNFCPDCRED